MKAGETGYLKITIKNFSDEAMQLVDEIIFSIKSECSMVQKRFPGNVTLEDGAFYIPLTQEDTTALIGRFAVEAQINFSDRSVSKSTIESGKISQTLSTEFVINNFPADEYGEFELYVEPIQVISGGGGGVTSYNQLTNKPSINSVVLVGNKTFAELGLNEYIQEHHEELKGDIGPQGPKGDSGYTPQKGVDYFDGKDGFSPHASVTPVSDGVIVSITDATGSSTAKVYNGAKGDKGDTGERGERGLQGIQGIQGEKGQDGYTPVKGVDYFDGAKGEDGYTPIKGVDYFDGERGERGETGPAGPQGETGPTGGAGPRGPQGEQGIQGPAGEPGTNGVDGFSPSASVERVSDGVVITITDKDGTTQAKVNDGQGGESGSVGYKNLDDTLVDCFKPSYTKEKDVTWVENAYYRYNGALTTSGASGLAYCRFPVNVGEKYRVVTVPYYYACAYVLFDADNKVVSAFPTQSAGNNTVFTDIIVEIPENAVTMVVNKRISYGGYVYEFEKAVLNIPLKEKLEGKEWCVCGDSFTRGGWVAYNGRYYENSIDVTSEVEPVLNTSVSAVSWHPTYPRIIAERTKCYLHCGAYGGRAFTAFSGASYPFSATTSAPAPIQPVGNYTNIPDTADYITLSYGLNECNEMDNNNALYGAKGDTSNTTLWGAYDTVIKWIRANRPRAKLGIILEDAWTSKKYHDTVIDICKYYQVPYLDLSIWNANAQPNGAFCTRTALPETADFNQDIIVSKKNSNIVQALADGEIAKNEHPTIKSHLLRADIIQSWLETL